MDTHAKLWLLPVLLLSTATPSVAQYPAGQQSSPNVHVVSHVPLGPYGSTFDIEIEQELSRPYVYVSRADYGKASIGRALGFDILDIKDPAKAHVIHRWRIENQDLHRGTGGNAGKYFKLKGRYYYAQAF